MLNWTIYIIQQYIKPLNGVQIEVLALDRNTWNHLTVQTNKL